MNYGLIISHRFPHAIPIEDYNVVQRDDGTIELTFWNKETLGPRPTDDIFRSWWLDAEKHNKRHQLRALADAEYRAVMFPEGAYTEIEKDEIIEKKAAGRAGVNPNFRVAEKNASDKIDVLRQKRIEKWQTVNSLEQQAGETLEQAVERVRGINW